MLAHRNKLRILRLRSRKRFRVLDSVSSCSDTFSAEPISYLATSGNMAGRQDHNVGGGGMDPELGLKDRVDLEHAGDKEAQKLAPREDNYDPTSEHAKGSSGEKVCTKHQIFIA